VRMPRISFGLAVAACLSVTAFAGVVIAQSGPAPPGNFTLGEHRGFFRAVLDDAGDRVINEGLNPGHSSAYGVNNFVRDVNNALYNRAPMTFAGDPDGAAYIILAMLGYRQNQSAIDTSNKARAQARAEFARWEALVRAYDAAGRVNYNTMFRYSNNTYWQGNNGGSNPHDVAWYHVEPQAIDPSIVFSIPGGGLFAIKHDCGNPVGGQTSLTPLTDFQITGQVTATSGSQSANSSSGSHQITVSPGATVNFTYNLRNVGTTRSPSIAWDATSPPAGIVRSGSSVLNPGQSADVFSQPVTISINATNGTRVCRELRWRPTSETNNGITYSGQVCAVVQVVLAPTCGNIVVNPDPVETGATGYTISTSVNYAPSAAQIQADGAAASMNVTITRASGAVVQSTSQAMTVSGSTATGRWSPAPINQPGEYTVTWGVTDTATPSANISGCTGQFSVVSKPYFRVYGGDAWAGATFGPTCAANSTTGRIAALNKGSAGGYAGSGAEVAAMANDVITEFVSASTRTAAPLTPKGLTFANSGPEYGQSFDSKACIPDYWSTATGVIPPSLTITGQTVNGKQDVYVAGDVYITGDIVYAGSGSWTTTSLPYYRLIVRGGNIYISNSVRELSGLYVALPDDAGRGGMIYTCALGASVPTADQVANSCGNRLTVYGAFIANHVKLLRTGGTLGSANPREPATATAAAEVFVYSPELWVTIPQNTGQSSAKYDAITSLPPVL
jgi:hypothetical protein